MRTGRSEGQDDLVLYIVDADASARDALCRLAISAGFGAKPFTSVDQFVTQSSRDGKGCVLLDSSLLHVDQQFKATMRSRGIDWPVIVLCPSVDEGARREARAFGAHFLLNMPVDAQALFDAIAWVTEEQG